MYTIERKCHKKFEPFRVRGEYFAIPFEDACAELDCYREEIAAALKTADENFLDELKYFEELKEQYINSYVVTPFASNVNIVPNLGRLQAPIDRVKLVNGTLVDTIKDAPVVAKSKKNPRRVVGQKALVCLYVFCLTDGNVIIVKFAQSKDVEACKKQIEKLYDVTITTYYKTCELPRKVARAFEQACHRIFAPFKVRGELFAVEYETALRIVSAVEELLRACPIIFDEERAEKLLNIGSKIKSLAANQSVEKALLVEAANIIAGKDLVGVVGDIFLPASK